MSNIVLIHGQWETPLSWQGWKERFESRGHDVLAPGWPGVDDRVVEAIRRDASALEGLGIREIVDHFETIIRRLDEPPIIMGHSFGGLVTQILVDRGLGSAGVGIAASPFRGMLGLPYSTVRVAMSGGLKNPFGKSKTVMLTPKQFHYAFTNTLDAPEAAEVYERLPIPGPARTLFQAAFANLNPKTPIKVNYKNDDRAPLLLIAPGRDRIIPTSTSKAAFKLQSESRAKTELKEYPERSHYIVGEPGWEEVADDALDWAEQSAKGSGATREVGLSGAPSA
jgi:alpha-beta hydrolase superfamily lysophospholipase